MAVAQPSRLRRRCGNVIAQPRRLCYGELPMTHKKRVLTSALIVIIASQATLGIQPPPVKTDGSAKDGNDVLATIITRRSALLGGFESVALHIERARANLGPQKTYPFEFHAAPWAEVLEYVSEIIQLPLATSYKPTGSFTFEPVRLPNGQKKRYAEGEIFDAINGAFAVRKFMVIRRAATFTVWPADEPLPPELLPFIEIEEMVKRGKSEMAKIKIPAAEVNGMMAGFKGLVGACGQVFKTDDSKLMGLLDTSGNIQYIFSPEAWGGQRSKMSPALTRNHIAVSGVATGMATTINYQGFLTDLSSAVDSPDRFDQIVSAWLAQCGAPQHLVYARPSFSAGPWVFCDLVQYAPGMNTMQADLVGVPPLGGAVPPKGGTPTTGTWRKFKVPGDEMMAAYDVSFKEPDQFALERVLSCGLRERVLCDGKTLWHLYPDIGLGAKRPATKHHLAEVLPGQFAGPGEPTEAPNLQTDNTGLVIVPMPLRTLAHLKSQHHLPQDLTKLPVGLPDDVVIQVIASASATRAGPLALDLFGQQFHSRGDKRIGFYVLVAAAGQDIDAGVPFKAGADQPGQVFNVAGAHPESPLARYLARIFDSRPDTKTDGTGSLQTPHDSFLWRLCEFHDLYQTWQTDRTPVDLNEDQSLIRLRTLDFIGKSPLPAFDWLMMHEMYLRGIKSDGKVRKTLVALKRARGGDAELAYAARYTWGLSLIEAGREGEGRQELGQLYMDTLKEGCLPPVDFGFRDALLPKPGQGNAYVELMRNAASHLIRQGRPLDVIGLALQAHLLGDNAVATQLMLRTLSATKPGLETNVARLAAGMHFLRCQELTRAHEVLEPVLEDPQFKNCPLRIVP